MNQARRWWADISLGATFFDVISFVLTADKWRRPLLAEALVSDKKQQSSPFCSTPLVTVGVEPALRRRHVTESKVRQ